MVWKIVVFSYLAAFIHFFHSEKVDYNYYMSETLVEFNEEKFLLDEKKHFKEVSHTELVCLRDNILHEAGVESDDGKLSVSLVTLNRVDDKHYPNDICGVVNQRTKNTCQFSWRCMKETEFSKSQKYIAYKFAKKIVEARQNGNLFDITHGSLFYHADYVNPYWADSLKFVGKIDTHLFYKRS